MGKYIFLALFVLKLVGECQSSDWHPDDYYDEYEDYYDEEAENHDFCNDDYYTIGAALNCTYPKFPEKTIQEVLGNSVVSCCPYHGYLFNSRCQDHEYYGEDLCRAPFAANWTLPTVSMECPVHCTTLLSNKFDLDNVEIQDGKFVIKNASEALQTAEIKNYCASYQCHNGNWKIGFHLCVCPDVKVLEKMDKTQIKDPKLPRCCPESFMTHINENHLFCPLADKDKMVHTCQGHEYAMVEGPFEFFNETIENNHWHEPKNASDGNYCFGWNWPRWRINDPRDPFQMQMFICDRPCEGRNPCLKTCVLPTRPWTNSEILKKVIPNVKWGWEIFEHMQESLSLHKICKAKKKTVKWLNQTDFTLVNDLQAKEIVMIENGRIHGQEEFCVDWNDDQKILKGHICISEDEGGSG